MNKLLTEYRRQCIISSVLVLSPILAGLLLWDRLPNNMVTHWGADGVADGMGSKVFAVFGAPLLLLAGHWLCLLFTCADPGNKHQNRKALGLLFWIMPTLSLLVSGITYSTAMGWSTDPSYFTAVLMAVLFIVMGNYLPKVSRNSTFGIKLPWTLRSDENWDLTHRMGGKLWMAGGFILLVAAFLPEDIFVAVLLADILAMTLIPCVYSYLLYKKQQAAGTYAPVPATLSTSGKLGRRVSLAITLVVLVLVGALMFTGDIRYQLDEDSFTIQASYYGDLTVSYDEIHHIELRERDDPGMRTNGFGSFRLSMGTFKNEEFNRYTRYTYTGQEHCIVLEGDGRTLVIGGETAAETQSLFQTLSEKLSIASK